MEESRVIEKILKLVALGTNAGATEAEAEAAMRQAHKMLAKHNLTMAQIEAKGGKGEDIEELGSVFPGYQWARIMVNAIAELYFCKYYYVPSRRKNHYSHFFVGKHSNAITAAEISKYVVVTLKRAAGRERRKHGSHYQSSFLKGAAFRIQERCRELIEASKADSIQVSESKALVLADVYSVELAAAADWMDQQHPGMRETKHTSRPVRDSAGYYAGREAANTVGLRPQVKGG